MMYSNTLRLYFLHLLMFVFVAVACNIIVNTIKKTMKSDFIADYWYGVCDFFKGLKLLKGGLLVS
jgi:hypothetical protein